MLRARFSSSAGEVKKSKVKICLIIISKNNITPIVPHRSQVSRKFLAKVYEYLEKSDCVMTIALAVAWKTIRQLRWQKIYFVTRALTRVSLLNSWDGTKCGEKKLKIPLAKQLSYRYLDILVYNCRIGHSSTITTEVNHYTISNNVYKNTWFVLKMVDEWPYVIRLYLPVKSWFLLRLAETDRDRFKADKE